MAGLKRFPRVLDPDEIENFTTLYILYEGILGIEVL